MLLRSPGVDPGRRSADPWVVGRSGPYHGGVFTTHGRDDLTSSRDAGRPAGAVTLTKHHGLGNDFLVALEPARELTSADAKRWCDRRTGIGADGLIQARRNVEGDDGRWTMKLWNADGGRAEISGNGIRCVGHAIGLLTAVDGERTITVATDAGDRQLTLHPQPGDTWLVRVGMGPATEGPPPSTAWAHAGLAVTVQQGVDIGNPHLVAVLDDDAVFDEVDMATVGPVIEADYAEGINVHLIRIADHDRIDLNVWERGVGVTRACGSGACAAAWAAHRRGLVGTEITVTMPGGSATVELTGTEVVLIGPATYVGSILLG